MRGYLADIGPTRLAAIGLMLAGAALLVWAGSASLTPPPRAPFELSVTPASGGGEAEAYKLGGAKLESVDVRAAESGKRLAHGVIARAPDGRAAPLSWRNDVTESILFADIRTEDDAKVLAAIREHVPQDAVVLAWWDLSRRIRLIAERAAPLDDPSARGLMTPSAWRDAAASLTGFWGAHVGAASGPAFEKFVDALLMDEMRGADALTPLAAGKPAYIALRLSDIWKAAATGKDRISIAYRDFPAAGGPHGVMKAARQWMEEQKIEGGYAVEPIGTAVRLHYLTRKMDQDLLLAQLLPFSTSNPMRLDRFELVYQHKDYWIYKLAPAKM